MKLALIILGLIGSVQVEAATRYQITLTNAGALHFSPPVVYVLKGQTPLSAVGKAATRGFVSLCQKGATQTRENELRATPAVSSVLKLKGLNPGESTQFEVSVDDPMAQSVQLESMYGETKDVCALGTIGSHSLYALKTQVTPEFLTKDDVVETGAFTRPSVMNAGYQSGNSCPRSTSAVECIRELSQPAMPVSAIRFFAPYLPSVLTQIETRFGSAAAERLNLSPAGDLRIKAVMIH